MALLIEPVNKVLVNNSQATTLYYVKFSNPYLSLGMQAIKDTGSVINF